MGRDLCYFDGQFSISSGKCIMDSAFVSANNPSIISSAQQYSAARSVEDIVCFHDATSMRQAAEWGMHAILGSFPRLTERIQFEENGEHFIILKLVPLLYNFCCETIGLNQICNTFLPS